MKMSDDIKELATALAKAQFQFQDLVKSKDGYGYKYADLAAVLRVIREPLANNDLAISQLIDSGDNGETYLVTMLMHKSGQYLSSRSKLVEATLSGNAGKNPVQKKGASISYERRYSIQSILGLAQADDDAACCGPERNERRPQPQKKTPVPKKISAANVKRVEEIMAKLGGGDEKECLQRVNSWLSKGNHKPVKSISALNENLADMLIAAMERSVKK